MVGMPIAVKGEWLVAVAASLLAAPATGSDRHSEVPDTVSQGALVVGSTAPGNTVEVGGRRVRVAADGTFVFGVARDATGRVPLRIDWFDGATEWSSPRVVPREWDVEVIDGVPPETVEPPKAVAERIAREAAAVAAARTRDDARTGFAQAFAWPVEGRISGRFGSGRVYNGRPGGGHSGMDIAATEGTPVRAPADGVVTLAGDLYITGGTLLLDHGHGVSSNFLHLSRIDVAVGDTVEQGQVIGAVGSTGRATGPHLHWGMNWFDVRVDPLLVLERGGATAGD
jgi:murein DD-endopeptidase MepM/ murein hydrolase activator NlpD